TVKLAVRILDEGGGIGPKAIWRVNGRTQGKDTAPGLGEPAMIGNFAIMEQTFRVDDASPSEIEVIAYNYRGLMATPPLAIEGDAWGPTIKQRPKLFGLALGVDNYLRKDWQLSYAAKDAATLAAALKKVASEKVKGSPLFADVQVKPLLDSEVTERNLAA